MATIRSAHWGSGLSKYAAADCHEFASDEIRAGNQVSPKGAMGLVSRGTGNDGPVSTATASSFLDAAGTMGGVTISEQIETARRERAWALASALAGGAPIRTLAGAWLVRTARFAAITWRQIPEMSC